MQQKRRPPNREVAKRATERYLAKWRATQPDRTCEHCGGAFKPNPHTQARFCSRPCHRLSKGQQWGEPKPCEACGELFRPRNRYLAKGWERFCSKRCKGLGWRIGREDSFLRFVPYGPWLNNVCHEWLGKRDRAGYGIFNTYERTKNGAYRAHVYAWERANGQNRPTGMQICHRCDNPPCVNPAHLFLGTSLDNMRDKVAKGRHRWGYAPPKHRS